MPRFVAFLRGVSPLNARMPELRACFEAAGYTQVRTVLSSGNVVFDAGDTDEHSLEQRAEAAMVEHLDRSFYTIIRSRESLLALLADDPYTRLGIPAQAKRVVSFLREPVAPRVALPLTRDWASVFLAVEREVYSAYLPTAQGPVFMQLIERAFGKDITTRTVDTVARCAAA